MLEAKTKFNTSVSRGVSNDSYWSYLLKNNQHPWLWKIVMCAPLWKWRCNSDLGSLVTPLINTGLGWVLWVHNVSQSELLTWSQTLLWFPYRSGEKRWGPWRTVCRLLGCYAIQCYSYQTTPPSLVLLSFGYRGVTTIPRSRPSMSVRRRLSV